MLWPSKSERSSLGYRLPYVHDNGMIVMLISTSEMLSGSLLSVFVLLQKTEVNEVSKHQICTCTMPPGCIRSN